MFHRVIIHCTQMLNNVGVWLDKAEHHAASKKFDIAVLMSSRLAPDQKPFVYQVQSACDYVKAGAAWLSGQAPPRHPDDETTITELRARLAKTILFAESVKEGDYAGAEERRVTMTFAPPGSVIVGADYLIQMVVPNVFFHVTMAYAILRHNGVDIGKMDFLGPINWRPA